MELQIEKQSNGQTTQIVFWHFRWLISLCFPWIFRVLHFVAEICTVDMHAFLMHSPQFRCIWDSLLETIWQCAIYQTKHQAVICVFCNRWVVTSEQHELMDFLWSWHYKCFEIYWFCLMIMSYTTYAHFIFITLNNETLGATLNIIKIVFHFLLELNKLRTEQQR